MIGVDSELRGLAAWMEAAAAEVIDAIIERQREQVPGYLHGEAPATDAAARDGARSMLTAICAGLANGREAPAHLPPGAVHQAALAAEEGLPFATVARTYAVAHSVVWEHLIAEIERRDLDPPGRAAVLQLLSHYLFGFVGHVTTELADVYAKERDRLVRDRERRKAALVRDLLAGLPVPQEHLAYELRSEHVGVIAWGDEPEEAVTGLAEATGLRLLTIGGPGNVTWGWLGGRPTVGRRALRSLGRYLPPGATRLAVGDPAPGPEGFRATHRQAAAAHRVALLGERPLTRYDEVALESLVLHDERLARDIALRELGPLAAPDQRAATLRETLRAYYTTGQNASAAAALLGVHERTVSYRLQSAGERLGHPIVTRRDELAVALRVLATLGEDAVLGRTAPGGAPAAPSRTPGALR